MDKIQDQEDPLGKFQSNMKQPSISWMLDPVYPGFLSILPRKENITGRSNDLHRPSTTFRV